MLLAIDISTTGTKALLIEVDGRVIGSAVTPQPLWSEQSPVDWWAGIVQSVRQVLAEVRVSSTAVSAR